MFIATSQQLKAYDQKLIDYGYPIEILVDKASDCLLRHFKTYQKHLIVCGPGNNGADGISLGIKLFKQNKKVTIIILGNLEKRSSANKYYLDEAMNLNMDVRYIQEDNIDEFKEFINDYEVIVDAIFGFGLNSDLRGIYKYVVDTINESMLDIVAIDIPTGLNPDTGLPYNSCICAYKTITLTAYKIAYLNTETELYTGKVYLELLDAKSFHEELNLAKVVDQTWSRLHLKTRIYNGHKGTYGRVMHITGSYRYKGAALLAAKASVYSGSGIVSVCSHDKVIDSLTCFVPEATALVRAYHVQTYFEGKDAILIGSGLGLNDDSLRYLEEVLRYSHVPVVIDGDALTLLSQNIHLLKDVKVPVVLTPHHGEFRRFVEFDDVSSMIEKANAFSREHNILLVLKGPNTYITDGYESYRNTTGNKAMASAGMGDVLAGMIVSLLGQGYKTKDACLLGVYLHGLCGDKVAQKNYTVVASQLIERIPEVMMDTLEML